MDGWLNVWMDGWTDLLSQFLHSTLIKVFLCRSAEHLKSRTSKILKKRPLGLMRFSKAFIMFLLGKD